MPTTSRDARAESARRRRSSSIPTRPSLRRQRMLPRQRRPRARRDDRPADGLGQRHARAMSRSREPLPSSPAPRAPITRSTTAPPPTGRSPRRQTATCIDGADCYSITVSEPAVRPVQHWDALLQETLSIGVPEDLDAARRRELPGRPTGAPFYAFIENLFHNGITGGCAGRQLLPDRTRHARADGRLPSEVEVRRGARPAAVHRHRLHRRALHGRTVRPLDRGARRRSRSPAAAAAANYCPGNTVTRQQMAVFLLKAFEGSTYVPPACTGIFDDVPCTPGTGSPTGSRSSPTAASPAAAPLTPPLYCPTNPEQPRPDGGVPRQDVRSRALRRLTAPDRWRIFPSISTIALTPDQRVK